MKSSTEILDIWIQNGKRKANLSITNMFLLGVMAGIFIGLGAFAFIQATAASETAFEAMVGKFVGAAIFPAGLMMVIFLGAELFTGNNLLMLAYLDDEISMKQMLTNWGVVYLGNLCGAILLAFLLSLTSADMSRAIAIAESKANIQFMDAIVKGILCNILVVLACWMQAGSQEMFGKIALIWFPIMLFVFVGFEHSVANMTYIPLGIFAGANVSWFAMIINNLLPVTIGNLIGGALFIPLVHYYCYKK